MESFKFQKEKSSMFTDLLSPDDFSIADSFLKCKNRLWKRFSSLTSGWKTPRPSKQLVKKATKQMRREHKATITLAVVLGRFYQVIIAYHHRPIPAKLTLRIQFSITHFLKQARIIFSGLPNLLVAILHSPLSQLHLSDLFPGSRLSWSTSDASNHMAWIVSLLE